MISARALTTRGMLVYQKKGAPVATYAQLENGAVTRVYAGIPARKVQ